MSQPGEPVYSREHLPMPVEAMDLHRKTVLTRATMVDGPFTVHTREGAYTVPSGWRGFLAVDTDGHPYPIAVDEYHATYEPVAYGQPEHRPGRGCWW
jgi:hypothetical protein